MSLKLLCYLLYIVQGSVIYSTAVSEASEIAPQTGPPLNYSASEISENPPLETSVSDDSPAGEPPGEGTPDSRPASWESQSKNKFEYKPLGVHLVQKFSNWFRPVYEKWSRFKDFLTYPDHPNYGGGILLDPQEIWDKWHEKGHHFLTGLNGAVYGLAPMGNHDYPFAYRGLGSSKKTGQNQSS